MGASIVLGLAAVRRRDFAGHRVWMMRAYALGLGAGTQIFTVGFGEAVFGTGVVRADLLLGSAWVINLAVAEWIIRRPTPGRARAARSRAAVAGSS
jgi:drug/metabolite transporter (DMT)-like permease